MTNTSFKIRYLITAMADASTRATSAMASTTAATAATSNTAESGCKKN